MNSFHKLMVGGAMAIVTFDAAMALASKRFAFDYASIAVGAASLCIYLAIGFVAAAQGNLRSSAVAGASTGLVDATLGWSISWIIIGGEFGPPNAVGWAATVIAVVGLTSIFGILGGGIARLFKRRSARRRDLAPHTDERRP
jgi:hypothetical protein